MLSRDALLMAINDFYVSMNDNAMQLSQPWLLHLAQAELDKYEWVTCSPVTVEQDACVLAHLLSKSLPAQA